MTKTIFIFVALLINLISYSQDNGNYFLIINNDSIKVDLDKPIQYKVDSGKELTIKIAQPEILTYSDDMISFSHHKSLSVSDTQIEEGIEQCMIMKSTGNGFMVQKYKTMDPSSLTQFMLREITKESINYGYSKIEKPFKKKLRSGETIEGIEATLTYKGENEIYTVASYGAKDEGIIVVTMLLTDEYKQDDQEVIGLFLETLEIKKR